MDQPPQIKAGETYCVVVDKGKVKVKAIRPAALANWWLCETVPSGDPVMIPTEKLLACDD